MEKLNLFDTHCHLCDSRFSGDIDRIFTNAGESGVTAFMVPGISIESSVRAAELSETRAGVYASAGIHPDEIESICNVNRVPEILLRPGVIAVGETGLDFYHDRIPRELQIECFRKHITIAEAYGLTLIVHSRSAEEEVLEVLAGGVSVPVIMHCYTGPGHIAEKAAEIGYYIGFAGPLTYRKNEYLRELAKALPAHRILIETDSPYLPPEPVRGSRNEPSNVKFVAAALSKLWGSSMGETAGILFNNSMRALQLAPERRTDLVYCMYDNIYMNITGLCTNSCRFCIKNLADGIGGYYLKHHAEPDEKQLESIIGLLGPEMGKELVFCGYGEPTMRPGLLRKLAEKASRRGFPVRLNTNGTCLTRLSVQETEELLTPFDSISVSLNASSQEEYNRVCRPVDAAAWDRLLDFIRLASKTASVRLTAVEYPGVNMEGAAALASNLGLPLRIRG